MATIEAPIVKCPKCGGELWDNRESKKTPKSPDYKCKNTACAEGFWFKKPKAAPAASPSAPISGGRYTLRELYQLWAACFDAAEKKLVAASRRSGGPKLGFPMADVLAGAATLFIGAQREGLHAPQPLDEIPKPLQEEESADVPF
jgi:hypothetical protein